MQKLNIAVVGSGISGLAAAWLLSKRHNVTLLERESRLGGHANTFDVVEDGQTHPIDTGFIVYNTITYPNLTALFEHLNVTTAESCMSFGVSLDHGAYEYSGTGISGLFGQPANVLKPDHLRLVYEIFRFFREADDLAKGVQDTDLSLGQWLVSKRYSRGFIERHILPMGAAIWSVSPDQMLQFPVASFARFFCNHGLLQVRNRPKWRTVRGGSRNYVEPLIRDFDGTVRLGFEIERIRRVEGGVDVCASNGVIQRFDQCVLACHSDEALAMLHDADPLERRVLSGLRYSQNTAVLHKDAALMPKATSDLVELELRGHKRRHGTGR